MSTETPKDGDPWWVEDRHGGRIRVATFEADGGGGAGRGWNLHGVPGTVFEGLDPSAFALIRPIERIPKPNELAQIRDAMERLREYEETPLSPRRGSARDLADAAEQRASQEMKHLRVLLRRAHDFMDRHLGDSDLEPGECPDQDLATEIAQVMASEG